MEKLLRVEDILNLKSGMYFGKTLEGNDVIVVREEGYGFTYNVDEGRNCLWCTDYDEKGNAEASYPEF